jgi:hypothetical protein
MQMRARFTPARDSRGRPAADSIDSPATLLRPWPRKPGPRADGCSRPISR